MGQICLELLCDCGILLKLVFLIGMDTPAKSVQEKARQLKTDNYSSCEHAQDVICNQPQEAKYTDL